MFGVDREHRQDDEHAEHAQAEDRRPGRRSRATRAGVMRSDEGIAETTWEKTWRWRILAGLAAQPAPSEPQCRCNAQPSYACNRRCPPQHGLHPRTRRAHAQPEEHQSRSAAQPADRDHRAVGLRQVVARLRHALRRRPAPLRRIAVGLRAAVPAADGKARCRSDRRPVAGDFDRAEGDQPQSALDRRHGHRNSRLPAPAVRARRRAALPRSRHARCRRRACRRWSITCCSCPRTRG